MPAARPEERRLDLGFKGLFVGLVYSWKEDGRGVLALDCSRKHGFSRRFLHTERLLSSHESMSPNDLLERNGQGSAKLLASPSIHDASAMLFPIERQAYVLQQILIDLVIQGGMQGKYLP